MTVVAAEVECTTIIELHEPEVWLRVWSKQAYDLPRIKTTLAPEDLAQLATCTPLSTRFLPARRKGVDPETFIFERLDR